VTYSLYWRGKLEIDLICEKSVFNIINYIIHYILYYVKSKSCPMQDEHEISLVSNAR